MKLSADIIVSRIIREDSELGAKLSTRVFPEVAPEGTAAPWAVFQRIGSQDTNDHEGYADLSVESYQVTAWTNDARERRLLRDALQRAFRMREVEVDGTTALVAKTDDRDQTDDGPPRLYGAQIDISVSL